MHDSRPILALCNDALAAVSPPSLVGSRRAAGTPARRARLTSVRAVRGRVAAASAPIDRTHFANAFEALRVARIALRARKPA